MKREHWAVIGLIAIYLLAGLVEPCDGHSCAEVIDGR
jgi:hypothetical protein